MNEEDHPEGHTPMNEDDRLEDDAPVNEDDRLAGRSPLSADGRSRRLACRYLTGAAMAACGAAHGQVNGQLNGRANVGANGQTNGETKGQTDGLASVSSADLPLRQLGTSTAKVPAIGMGTWLTFDVDSDDSARHSRVQVMKAFLAAGGGMLDSSPMYGHAEELIGHSLDVLDHDGRTLYAASKIWTPLALLAGSQMKNTEYLWGVQPMDLMYVHNLLNVDAHLPKLRDWQSEGRIRQIGLTTSHGRRHDELVSLLRTEPVDVVQLTYNMRDREAEKVLLPLATDRGVGVVINRPLQGGALPDDFAGRPLPSLARELGCTSWAQYQLLWVISHPDVTCAIPATSRVDHLRENVAVSSLPMPDAGTRRAMLDSL